MPLHPPLLETLRIVAGALQGARDDWWVIASAAAALHGVDQPPVGDVDVLASDRDAAAVLARLGLAPLETEPHPLFRSRLLGRWTAPPMAVEIMSGFHIRAGDEWREVRPTTRQPFGLGGLTIFAPARDELADMLTAIGRPKDLARARRLRAA